MVAVHPVPNEDAGKALEFKVRDEDMTELDKAIQVSSN